MNEFDPWQLPREAEISDDLGMNSPDLLIDQLEGIEPLTAQMGVMQKKSVPDALYDLIFGQPPVQPGAEALSPLQTYAVIDAAKIGALPEMLERSGLRSLCLFKGQSEQELAEVAPWIVQLHEDSAFTRNLFTRGRAPWQLWDDAPGVYIRSRCQIDELQAHLRHFTRVQNGQDEWFYFRFWEPAVAAVYFPTLTHRLELARRWFLPRRAPQIDALVIIDPPEDRAKATVLRPYGLENARDFVGNRFLDDGDVARLAASRTRADVAGLAGDLRRTFADDIALSDHELKELTGRTVDRLVKLGFRQRDNLFVMLAWEIFFGPGFETIDSDGQLARIMRSDRDEAERLDMLKQRMEKLG